jgi:signal transduction histidine kinase
MGRYYKLVGTGVSLAYNTRYQNRRDRAFPCPPLSAPAHYALPIGSPNPPRKLAPKLPTPEREEGELLTTMETRKRGVLIRRNAIKALFANKRHVGTRWVIDLFRRCIKYIPRWRSPLVGYLCAVPILVLSLFIAVFMQRLLQRFLFPATFMLLSIIIVAIVWGIGPALLMLVIGVILLNYYFAPLMAEFPLIKEGDIVQVIPVFVIGLIILLVVGQRERAHKRIQAVDQELQRYASGLETMNSRLAEANREKEGFLSIASHELKTPVTTIRGYSQMLLRHLAKRSASIDVRDFEPAFKRIDEQTVRLSILIEELLDVNNGRSNGVALSKNRYDLNQLCRKIVEDQRLLTKREVVFYPWSEPLELEMNVDRITQVVINLVSNAIKYSPEDKPVEVCVSRDGQRTLLRVRDHGCGISPDELPHIFEMFYRTHGARSSTTGGLGLGLAISKGIVEQHGGSIWCESELGVGTTFFVELPSGSR